MSDSGADAELLVLLAVRLAGVANVDALLDRTFLSEPEIATVMEAATAAGRVERYTFGETSGWVLTEAGAARLRHVVAEEVARRGAAPALETTLAEFEPVNERFVALVSGWQLRSTSSTNDGYGEADPADVHRLLAALAELGTALREVLTTLRSALPRFGRYPVQYASALDHAGRDGLRWVTGTGLLSCHVVWAELHQDLLSSLGRER